MKPRGKGKVAQGHQATSVVGLYKEKNQQIFHVWDILINAQDILYEKLH